LLGGNTTLDAALLSSLLTPDEVHARTEPLSAAGADSDQDSAPANLSALFQGTELPPFAQVRREFERAYLIEVLQRARGNVTAAAKMAGRHRTDFHELLRRHNLSSDKFRQG